MKARAKSYLQKGLSIANAAVERRTQGALRLCSAYGRPSPTLATQQCLNCKF